MKKKFAFYFLSNTKSIFFAHSLFFPTTSRQKFDLAKKFKNGFIEKVKCSLRQLKHKVSNLSKLAMVGLFLTCGRCPEVTYIIRDHHATQQYPNNELVNSKQLARDSFLYKITFLKSLKQVLRHMLEGEYYNLKMYLKTTYVLKIYSEVVIANVSKVASAWYGCIGQLKVGPIL